MKKYSITTKPFYYGKRLKAYIKIITNLEDNTKIYIAQLFTHNKEMIKQKTFFNVNANHKEQTKQYIKCHDFVLNYLNTCKY